MHTSKIPTIVLFYNGTTESASIRVLLDIVDFYRYSRFLEKLATRKSYVCSRMSAVSPFCSWVQLNDIEPIVGL